MPWEKGQSGNPGGRPKAALNLAQNMAKLIAERTDNGQKLIEFAWAVYTDENAPLAERRWAHDWLTDRGAGKASQSIELFANVQSQNVTFVEMVNFDKLSSENLFELESILSTAVGAPLLLGPADDE